MGYYLTAYARHSSVTLRDGWRGSDVWGDRWKASTQFGQVKSVLLRADLTKL
jgi:hypothetical protein